MKTTARASAHPAVQALCRNAVLARGPITVKDLNGVAVYAEKRICPDTFRVTVLTVLEGEGRTYYPYKGEWFLQE
jgi:hypothetical protein